MTSQGSNKCDFCRATLPEYTFTHYRTKKLLCESCAKKANDQYDEQLRKLDFKQVIAAVRADIKVYRTQTEDEMKDDYKRDGPLMAMADVGRSLQVLLSMCPTEAAKTKIKAACKLFETDMDADVPDDVDVCLPPPEVYVQWCDEADKLVQEIMR